MLKICCRVSLVSTEDLVAKAFALLELYNKREANKKENGEL